MKEPWETMNYSGSYLDTFCKKYFGKTPKEIRKEAIGKTV